MRMTQQQFEKRVKEKLALLGPRQASIAKVLKAKKIVGTRGCSRTCPIAKYLQKAFRSALSVCAYDSIIIDFKSGEGRKAFGMPTPKVVNRFMDAFDDGKYPELAVEDD